MENSKQTILNDLKLINFSFHRGHDGDGFNGDIVYKGKKIAHAYDDSWGGGVQYSVEGKFDTVQYKMNKILFDELNSKIKALPKLPKSDGFDFQLEQDLDFLVDDMINEITRKKDEKKGILLRKFKNDYEIYGWKVTLPTMIKKWGVKGLERIQKDYNKLKKDGEEILNTEYLASIGVAI